MRLKWDETGKRYYEMGVSNVVLFVWDTAKNEWGHGVPWNGVTNVTKSPDGAEPTDFWADNRKYGTLRSAETVGGSLGAYQSPEEFDPCDGSVELAPGLTIGQQTRVPFCLAYRTEIGNDISQEAGYRINIIYNATASPTEKAYDTINDSPDAAELSWDFDTTPINVTGHKPTASVELSSLKTDATKLKKIEDTLYGTDAAEATDTTPAVEETESTLLLPDQIAKILTED